MQFLQHPVRKNRICLLQRWEVLQAAQQGIKPNCKNHRHISRSKLIAEQDAADKKRWAELDRYLVNSKQIDNRDRGRLRATRPDLFS